MATETQVQLGTDGAGFMDRHDLWTDEQKEAAEEVMRTIEDEGLTAVRVGWGDQHGIVRGKTVTVDAFRSVIRTGLDANTGPLMFDTANDLVFNPFVPGGSFDVPAMTGCPDIVLAPDPTTFRILPWAPGTGWLLADMYFKDGTPLPFSSRFVLKRLLDDLRSRGLELVAGLEVEWYLTKLDDPMLAPEHLGGPGSPGEPPRVTPAQHGYQYQMESHTDELWDMLAVLQQNLTAVGLPLRTIEDEWGPGQLEFTFDPLPGLDAADAMLLFRTATKQIARRHGYHATFMCRPAFPGFFSSGWHLHQSLTAVDDGANQFTPAGPSEALSELGRHYVGGLLEHAGGACVFTMPTVTGYKRLRPYSLAPDRAQWGVDNRGAMIRVQAAPGDPSSHVENRIGEPAANPYLYMASQIISGIDGVDRKIDPGPPTEEPYEVDRPLLPESLAVALDALDGDPIFRERIGDAFVDFIVTLKRNELKRFDAFVDAAESVDADTVTDWEQREYFSTF